MLTRRHLIGLATCALAGFLDPATATFAQTVFDRLEVGVVEIDVTVRDRRGRSVAGLSRDDFSIALDGSSLPITHFMAIEGGRVRASAIAEETSPRSPEATTVVPEHLAIFFDESGLDPGERGELARRLVRELESHPESAAQVLVVGRRGVELEVYQPFTRTVTDLVRGVDAAAAGVPRNEIGAGLQDFLREVERAISSLDEAQGASGRGKARVLAARGASYASELIQEVARSTEVLQRLVGLMAGLPGRKAILYIGDTLALNPGEVIDGALRDAFSRFGISTWTEYVDATPAFSGGSAPLAALVERAASRQVVVYTLDVAGGRLPSLASAAQSSIDAGRSGGSQPTESWTPGIGSRRRVELRGAFRMLADATGGATFAGRRDGVLADVLGDLGTYYSIGVTAPEDARGDALALEVEVAGRRLEVRRRRAYRSRSADERDADRTVAALLTAPDQDASGERPLAASVVVGEPGPAVGELHPVPLSIRVPVADLAVVARDRAHAGQLSIFLVTSAAEMRYSAVRKIVLPITIANEELMTVAAGEAEHRIDLELPPGPARIAVGLRDDYDPDLTVLTLQLDVGLPSPSGP